METSLTDVFIGQRLEIYVIERLLGVGGMANVYQAYDTLHRREVAIKALSPGDCCYTECILSERFASLDVW